MSRLVDYVGRFQTTEDGPTAAECAVMFAWMVVVYPAAITSLDSQFNSRFSNAGAKRQTVSS